MKAAELGLDVLEVCQTLYGLDGELHNDEFSILCPHPDHEDHSPSCNVNIETGYWRCLSCGAKGDIITLGRHCLGKRRGEVQELLTPNNPQAMVALVQRRLRALQTPAHTAREISRHRQAIQDRPWLPADAQSPMAYRSGPLSYLLARGFTSETLERWGVRYLRHADIASKKGKLTIYNAIAIPIFDSENRLHSWCYRATDLSPKWQQETCRYLYTLDALDRPWIGLNFHRDLSEIVVTEGPLDAMWFDQHGIPAIAIGGNQRSAEKLAELERFRRITIFCDNDAGGKLATKQIAEVLAHRMQVHVARYPRGTRGLDPQQLCSADLELGVARARSWQSQSIRRRLSELLSV